MRLPALASGWTRGQYALLRAAFGAWLAIHFLHLLPWCEELFSREGVLADGGATPHLRLFPNLFAWSDAPATVLAAHAAGALAALFLAAGRFDRAAALFLWYLLACQFGRNPLILNPALPYVGLLLVCHALQPRAAAGAWRRDPRLHAALWILMSAGYLYSGLTKLPSPSWQDGSALAHVLENPLARDTALRAALASAPDELLRAASFGALALELAFAPLALLRRARPFVWGAMAGMHLALLLLVDFADLTAGMLFLHAFTFDPAWLRRARKSDFMGAPAVSPGPPAAPSAGAAQPPAAG